jgi:hypothetical protein
VALDEALDVGLGQPHGRAVPGRVERHDVVGDGIVLVQVVGERLVARDPGRARQQLVHHRRLEPARLLLEITTLRNAQRGDPVLPLLVVIQVVIGALDPEVDRADVHGTSADKELPFLHGLLSLLRRGPKAALLRRLGEQLAAGQVVERCVHALSPYRALQERIHCLVCDEKRGVVRSVPVDRDRRARGSAPPFQISSIGRGGKVDHEDHDQETEDEIDENGGALTAHLFKHERLGGCTAGGAS